MKGIGINLLVTFCTIILMVGIGEAVARYRGVPRLFSSASLSQKLGRDLPMNAESRLSCDEICKLQGQNTFVTFNGIGVRDIDHEQKKPDGVKRIVVIGDSMTEGERVSFEQTSFRQLQTLLNQYSSERWEVINLAQSGFGTLEEIIMLEELGLAYEPDIVVMQIYPNNDICDNAIGSLWLCGSDPFRPYVIEKKNGALQRTTGQPILNALRESSSLFVALETIFLKAKYHIKGSLSPHLLEKIRNKKVMERRKTLPLDPFSYIHAREEDQLPFVKEGWKITERLLTQLSEDLSKKNIAFVAYSIPPVWEIVHPADQWEDYMAAAPFKTVRLIRGYDSKRLQNFFKTIDRPFVPLLETFDKHRDEVLPYWDYHLNPNGHRIAAEAVFKMLQENGLVSVKE